MIAGNRTALRALTSLVMLVMALSPAAWGQNNRLARIIPSDISPLPPVEVLRNVAIDPALMRVTEQLDDPSYQARQEATVALRDAPWRNLELYALLEQMELTAEQRHRVLQVIAERLLTRPRGAVGIQIDPRRLPDVVIFKLLPELPARDILEIGDRITHLDSTPVQSWERFRWAVQSRVPGTKISIRVERDARVPIEGPEAAGDQGPFDVLDVEFVLGSADLLVNPQTGLRQPDGAYIAARRQEAQMASQRYAPHRLVEIDSGAEDLAETPPGTPVFDLQPNTTESPGQPGG